MWLGTVAPNSISGRTISSTYLDLPVTLSRPSLRGTDLPTIRLLFIRLPGSTRICPTPVTGGGARPADGIVYAILGHNGGEGFRREIRKGLGGLFSISRSVE